MLGRLARELERLPAAVVWLGFAAATLALCSVQTCTAGFVIGTFRDPPAAPAAAGPVDPWTKPWDVCDALAGERMSTTGWKHLDGDEEGKYVCLSGYVDVPSGEDGMPNTIAYYVEGEPRRVTQAKVVLHIHEDDPDRERVNCARFANAASVLARHLCGTDPPGNTLQSARKGHADTGTMPCATIRVTRERHVTAGYKLSWIMRPITEQ